MKRLGVKGPKRHHRYRGVHKLESTRRNDIELLPPMRGERGTIIATVERIDFVSTQRTGERGSAGRYEDWRTYIDLTLRVESIIWGRPDVRPGDSVRIETRVRAYDWSHAHPGRCLWVLGEDLPDGRVFARRVGCERKYDRGRYSLEEIYHRARERYDTRTRTDGMPAPDPGAAADDGMTLVAGVKTGITSAGLSWKGTAEELPTLAVQFENTGRLELGGSSRLVDVQPMLRIELEDPLGNPVPTMPLPPAPRGGCIVLGAPAPRPSPLQAILVRPGAVYRTTAANLSRLYVLHPGRYRARVRYVPRTNARLHVWLVNGHGPLLEPEVVPPGTPELVSNWVDLEVVASTEADR